MSGILKGRMPLRLLTVVAAFALLAAACGDDNTSNTTSPPATTAAPATTTTAAPMEPIKIGVVVPLSGPVAALGMDQLAGLEMARDEINAAGGILGRQIELVVKDDETDPTKAAQAARELVDSDHVEAIFGSTTSSNTLAIAAIALEAGIVQMHTGSADSLSVVADYPYSFRMAPNTKTQAETFVDFAKTHGYSKLAVLAENSALGTSAVDNLNQAVVDSGVEIVGVEYYEPSATDMTTQETKLRDANPDLFLGLGSGLGHYASIVKARNQLNWQIEIVSFAPMSNPAVTEQAGGKDAMHDVLAGQVWKNFVRPVSARVDTWLSNTRTKLGQDPLTRDVSLVAMGYDALSMLADGFNAVGAVDKDKFKTWAESAPYEGVLATYRYNSDRHEGQMVDTLTFVDATSFSDGTYAEPQM